MESQEQIELISKLQDYLMNADEGNLDESKNFILEEYLIKGIDYYSPFFRTYLIALMYRPCETELYIKLLINLYESFDNQEMISNFNQVLIETVFHLPGPQISGLFVLYRLYQLGYINIEDIINKIHLYRYENPEMKINLVYCYLWFAPEINDRNEYFLSLLRSDYDEFSKNNSIHLSLQNFSIDSMTSHNFELLRHYRKSGHNHRRLFMILMNDDIDSLQNENLNPLFDSNLTVNSSFYEICPFIQNGPTLIQTAAFFGSIKCFKYLLLNGANLLAADKANEMLPHFAVAGGNVEIIRICHQRKLQLIGASQIAALFHRNSILTWLIECECQAEGNVAQNNGTIIQNAAVTNNLNTIEMCLEKKVDVNGGNKKKTSLQNACENGNIESVTLLLSSKDIDINACVFKYFIFFNRISTFFLFF